MKIETFEDGKAVVDLYQEIVKTATMPATKGIRWIKVIKKIDEKEKDGWAFQGGFVNKGLEEITADQSSLYLVHGISGSNKYPDHEYELVELKDGEFKSIQMWKMDNMNGWALAVKPVAKKWLEGHLRDQKYTITIRIPRNKERLDALMTVLAEQFNIVPEIK